MYNEKILQIDISKYLCVILMLCGETKSKLHLLINCMQGADTLLICITQQKIPTEKKQLILRSLYYHPKAKLVFF